MCKANLTSCLGSLARRQGVLHKLIVFTAGVVNSHVSKACKVIAKRIQCLLRQLRTLTRHAAQADCIFCWGGLYPHVSKARKVIAKRIKCLLRQLRTFTRHAARADRIFCWGGLYLHVSKAHKVWAALISQLGWGNCARRRGTLHKLIVYCLLG
jgi:hypothetical protein